MNKVLLLNSSLQGAAGNSHKLAAQLIAHWQQHENIVIRERDLAASNLPHLTLAEMQAWAVPGDQQNPEQFALAAHSEQLLAELIQADAIVIGMPMYNLGVPSTFKAWIDRIARAGRTFNYTATGPKGLLEGKSVYVLAARGGVYQGIDKDTQSKYLQDVFALIGITDVHFIYLEGVNMSEEVAANAWQAAGQAIANLFPKKAA
ncbi:MAG: FMN-dependent NADH-azoreductase [Paraglaciecola sp.]|jgi:FMN-dependent NADH-azoreductase